MDTFCDAVIDYIKTEEKIEKVVALTLRDIFLNELIYVQYFDVWKQYDTKTKTWNNFEVQEFHDKLAKLRDFFSTSLPNYLTNLQKQPETILSTERTYLLKYMGFIEKYITTLEGEKEIIEQCKKCFHITV